MTALFAVDAGGSRAELAWAGGRRRFGPVHPASTADRVADERLRELLAAVRDAAAGGPALLWLATASLDPEGPAPELARVRAAAHAVGLSATLMVSNDAVPLLLGPGDAVAVVCGTGSGVLAAGAGDPPVRVGGREYLASDEGSAFDLGVGGLRAAVRAADGRGPATSLGRLLEDRTGTPLDRLTRDLAARPYPKPAVAALAPVVTTAWLDGDPVAADLVAAAVAALAEAVQAGRDRAGLAPGWTLVGAGGVFAGCPPLLELLAAQARGIGAAEVRLVAEPAAALLGRLVPDRPVPASWFGRCAWRLDLVREVSGGG